MNAAHKNNQRKHSLQLNKKRRVDDSSPFQYIYSSIVAETINNKLCGIIEQIVC